MKNELLIHWLLLIVVKIAQVIIIPVIISPNNLGALLHNYNFFWSKKKKSNKYYQPKILQGTGIFSGWNILPLFFSLIFHVRSHGVIPSDGNR